MFKYNDERTSSGYLEFQFSDGKNKDKYFLEDSLYVDVFEDFSEFLKIYEKYFGHITEYEDKHYTKEDTEIILKSLKKDIPKGSNRLIKWLEECAKNHDGFNILGV